MAGPALTSPPDPSLSSLPPRSHRPRSRPTPALPPRVCDGADLDAGAARAVCAAIAGASAELFGFSSGQMQARDRHHAVAVARQAAMYVAHVFFGVSLTATGAAFGRDRTTAAHACRATEERREDDGFDRMLAALEVLAARRVFLLWSAR